MIGKERNFGCIVRIAECSMLCTPNTVEILSEQESPIGSSSIPRVKRKAQNPSSTPSQKRYAHTTARVQGEEPTQTGPSSSGAVESTKPRGVSINDIPGYVAPTRPG